MGRRLVTQGTPALAVLLDTHALLWLVTAPEKVSAAAREALSEPATQVAVSAASAWEIAMKTRLGRLDGDAILAGRLSWEHRNPFDRMIVAQAARRNLTIATSDSRILQAALTPTLKT